MRFATLGPSDFSAFLEYKADFEERYSHPEIVDRETYGRFLDALENHRRGVGLAPGRVSSVAYYSFDEAERILGRINYRETLTEAMVVEGGHIGYEVRISQRRQGLGTRMVGEFLDYLRSQGRTESVLVTCDETNVASAKVILRNGGVYEDTRVSPRTGRPTKRFWIAMKGDSSGRPSPM